MKLRLTLDQAYEWAPNFLRWLSRQESAPNRETLIAWIEQPDIGYDRSDMVEFGRDLWAILSTRIPHDSGPYAVVLRLMDEHSGWFRGPLAMFELQQENQGRAADRRAELNRQVHNPESVRRWEDVPGAINTWEAVSTEYTCLTGQTL